MPVGQKTWCEEEDSYFNLPNHLKLAGSPPWGPQGGCTPGLSARRRGKTANRLGLMKGRGSQRGSDLWVGIKLTLSSKENTQVGWRENFSYKSVKIQLPDQPAFHTAGLQMPTSPLTSRMADKQLSGRQKAVHQGSVQVSFKAGDWMCPSTVRVTIAGGRVEGEVFLCLSLAYCERLNWLSLSQMQVTV